MPLQDELKNDLEDKNNFCEVHDDDIRDEIDRESILANPHLAIKQLYWNTWHTETPFTKEFTLFLKTKVVPLARKELIYPSKEILNRYTRSLTLLLGTGHIVVELYNLNVLGLTSILFPSYINSKKPGSSISTWANKELKKIDDRCRPGQVDPLINYTEVTEVFFTVIAYDFLKHEMKEKNFSDLNALKRELMIQADQAIEKAYRTPDVRFMFPSVNGRWNNLREKVVNLYLELQTSAKEVKDTPTEPDSGSQQAVQDKEKPTKIFTVPIEMLGEAHHFFNGDRIRQIRSRHVAFMVASEQAGKKLEDSKKEVQINYSILSSP